MISYSMNREDVLLQRVFANQDTGFYVDVGANSPRRFSNTKHFYDRGWRGINIEPSNIFEELIRKRPRDINLRLAASDHDGMIEFHECADTSLSSVCRRELPAPFQPEAASRVPARTLVSILDQYAERSIDFMSIDVEGHELQVLTGNDWKKHRPRILIVEATALLTHEPVHRAWEEILVHADYQFAYFDGINRFYVRSEDAGLLAHFGFPPTNLEYTPAEVADLRQDLVELEERHRRLLQFVRKSDCQLNLWYDLSTLVLFPGNHTGIPRVITKILEALVSMDHVKLGLCMYDSGRQRFVRLTRKLTLAGRVKKLLAPILRPCLRASAALGRCVKKMASAAWRRSWAWLAERPWLRACRGWGPWARRLQRTALVIAHAIKAMVALLPELAIGIRKPQHPSIRTRPLVFPFCLLCHNFLKLFLDSAPIMLLRQKRRQWQWLYLNIGGLVRVRPTSKPVPLSAKDVVVQVGWTPWLGGIGAAKNKLGFRYVSLVHDLIPVKLPHFVIRDFPAQFGNVTLEQIQVSDLILVNSECTRSDLDEFARDRATELPPTHVLRFGSEIRGADSRCGSVQIPGLSEGEPFVLTVSTLDPRKNHRTLYYVWRQLAQEFGARSPKLAVVGFPGLHDLIHEMRMDPLTKDKVLVLFPIDDPQLDWLYRNCLFTVYPSFYEGWGLPVAESLWYGKLCIASHASSIPEIGGDLVDYHDPYNVAECYRLVSQAAFDTQYRERREEQIRQTYRPTTWRECAESLCQAIQGQLLESGHSMLPFPQNTPGRSALETLAGAVRRRPAPRLRA